MDPRDRPDRQAHVETSECQDQPARGENPDDWERQDHLDLVDQAAHLVRLDLAASQGFLGTTAHQVHWDRLAHWVNPVHLDRQECAVNQDHLDHLDPVDPADRGVNQDLPDPVAPQDHQDL